MCAPAIGLVGAVVSAAGAMAQANAQANMDRHNAVVEKINARSRRWEGQQKQERIGAEAARRQGTAIALAGKGGVDPGYGSAALVIFREGREAEFADKSNAYLTAESAAIGHENKAKAFEMSAENHRKAGMISAASSFLSGLGGAVKGGGGSNALMINA